MARQTRETRFGNVLEIREAESEDAEALLAYAETISFESDYLSFGPGEFNLTVDQEREFLSNCQSAENQIFLVALVDCSIVASAMFIGGARKRDAHTGTLGLSVARAFWRQGIGAALMEELILWAEGNSVLRKLQLKVRTDNVAAIQLYLNHQFRFEGLVTEDFCIDGQYFDHYLMARRV